MAINFPDPNASPWYNDPANGGNGVTYVYTTGGYWTAVQVTGTNAIDQTTGDARYVNVSGDTMTGALLLDNAASVSAPDLSFDGDTDTGLYSSGTNTLNLVTGGNNRLVLDGAGRVGINTTSPSVVLDVNGAFRVTGESQFDADIYRGGNPQLGVAGTALFGGSITVRNSFGTNSVFRGQVVGSTDFKIDLRANGDAHFLGNVGIGTTSPGALLDLGTSTPILRFSDSDTTGYHQIQSSNSNFIINADPSNADTGSAISFKVDNSDAMRIDSSGNVGIGTTSPGQVLDVVGDAQVGPTSGTALLYLGTRGFSSSLKYNASTGDLDIAPRGGYGITFKSNTAGTTEWMRIDSSGNVGIGTLAPSGLLHAETGATTDVYVTSGAANASRIWFGDSATRTEASIQYSNVSDSLSISKTGGTGIVLDSSNRLLVGTTSDSGNSKLIVRGGTSTNIGVLDIQANIASTAIGQNNPAGYLRFKASDSGSSNYHLSYVGCLLDGPSSNSSDIPGALTFGTSSDGSGSPTERMRIDSSGNVQIRENSNLVSTGASLYLYDLAGSATSTNSSGRIAFYSSDLTDGASIRAEIANLYENSSADSALTFKTYNGSLSERMRISSTGQTGLLFSSTYGHVSYSSQGSSSSRYTFWSGHSSTDTTGSGGVHTFRVASNGDVKNITGTIGTISDAKLKENIVDAESQWEDLKAVRFRKYNLKKETGYDTHTQLGVIAQELEEVCPGLVEDIPDIDMEGNDLGTTTKNVKTSILTLKALVALQEAMERIETLEQRLTDAGL